MLVRALNRLPIHLPHSDAGFAAEMFYLSITAKSISAPVLDALGEQYFGWTK
jgi:hypothetical protein